MSQTIPIRTNEWINLYTMKKIIITLAIALLSTGVHAQDVQQAAAEAAKAISQAPEAEQKVEKSKYWSNSLKTNLTVGQTALTNWAAGGDNTASVQAFIDGNANWAKNEMFWNNRLQLDYGFIYTSSKPILQKSADRIYLESKWGYKAVENLYFSANYDFKSQFTNTFDYPTPSVKADGSAFEEGYKPVKADWKEAKTLKSGFLAPAYTNLALGLDYKPTKWLSVNFAPLTGGFVIVKDAALRKNYGMELVVKEENMTEAQLADYNKALAEVGDNPEILGSFYRSARFEFGAQLKVDVDVNVNDNFKYTSQVVLFSNYLEKPQNLRVNWDNRIDWKIAKYFSLTLATNLIYDDTVIIQTEEEIEQGIPGKQRIQFKESLAFGFTYTIASKK